VARVIRGGARIVRPATPRYDGERAVIVGLAEIARERARLREAAAQEIGTLALEVAARVIGERVAIEPALVERIVARALARAKTESSVRVTLHPDDRRALEARLGTLPAEIVLDDDPTQARGGCVVRGAVVTIDARIESAIAAIAHAMGVDAPT
jgi:flagellar assembly protein FliH